MKHIALLFCLTLLSHSVFASSTLETVEAIELSSSSTIGISVLDTATDTTWSYKGDQRFPMMSTFKTLLCAQMLYNSSNDLLDKEALTRVTQESIIPWSPITEKFIGETISTESACEATMLMSDNTAANIVLAQTGTPTSLTLFLRLIGDDITRLDRIEPELNEAQKGDVRDTTTPNAMTNTLNELLFGQTLTTADKNTLKGWMVNNKVSDPLLRSILPRNWSIADRSGAGGFGSRGITAVLWNEKRAPIIMSIYLTQTNLDMAARNQVIVEVGNAIFKEFNIN
ncbi:MULTISPECIES: class A beta-lactamase [Aliivibrio]|uniref:Beta-lactamase n=1 Tax=Aliivibrio finisterrensis TaxID=511998 RepID=A0A4Q5KQK1_9GAMM|nr:MULTISPECIES: class A beta-lactamase [Aliivibrio]MDD9180376.1 class A beta-lactamase [Aliivibrio sp. A6]RYU48991.1 class A beta-lactamase [Aliivibrio finisterrensis]RYU49271.1 class A beta-lactamase [Aliivibrio finisterrensis]RYU54562.1 class A beta-lactamase [Aliivibrio finisterrensis]RYU61221.1 class A beta-lactamase [Aliivibrio finisterrensis]